jgi:membrane-associated phospholipid phosphatase
MSSQTEPAGPLGWPRSRSLWVGIALLAAGVALGAVIFFVRGDVPFAVDVWWNHLLAEDRGGFLLWMSFALNWLGGGWFGIFGMPLLIALALALARRPWAVAAFLTSEVVSAVLVQTLKHTFGRARPDDILVVSDFGSFPSGHVANATTIGVALMVLIPRLWTVLAGAAWVLLMAFSRTYLGAHWLSDTLGGALVGSAAVLLIVAALAVPLSAEARRRTDAAARGPE